jgi:hypothetical protein
MGNFFQKTQHMGKREVLLVGSHFISVGALHARASADNPGLATLVDGRYIVQAGTIYPSNDAAAVGVVANDYDVHDGDVNMAIITHGVIKTAALPAHASSAAKAALPGINFYPSSAAANITRWLTVLVPEYIGEGDTALAEAIKVVLELDAGARFISATAAENLSNWTVTGGSTTKLEVKAIELLDDAKVELELGIQSGQTVAVGTLSAVPKHSIISNGQAPPTVALATVPAFWTTVDPLDIDAGDDAVANADITLTISDPVAVFASEAAAENLSNWTVGGGTTNKLEVKAIDYLGAKSVKVTVGLQAGQTTVAGALTLTPKDAALTGEAGLVAITIAVVA